MVARRILDGKDSPDEWAIALRNVAWGEPKSRGYLAAKTHDLLAYEPWTASPTAGMLEAFDVAVYSGDPTFIPQLANLARNGNSAVQRAATLALDRLAQTSPLAVMNFLNANPDEIADRPFVRADYFAKANLADNAQREAVEHYLTRQDVGVPEKTKFLHALASPGSFVGDSLLSTAAKPTDDDARYDAIAMATTGWLKSRLAPEVSGEIAWLFTRVTADP